LAKSPIDYVHSSAKFYLTGSQGVYEVTSYADLADIDLTKGMLFSPQSLASDFALVGVAC
jgi:hypothetical protein